MHLPTFFKPRRGHFVLEPVPEPFDLIGILADRCNCSYVLERTLFFAGLITSSGINVSYK
nr:hypothetical protein [Leptospira borgpetersenii]